MLRSSYRFTPGLAVAIMCASFSSLAHAHIELLSPVPRHTDLKEGPCGRGATDRRSGKITKLKPGATITVHWTETIQHPGHYRIAFDPDGTRFTDPTSFTDTAPRTYVLLDNIADKRTADYTTDVTLPNMETTNGTLQVIQVMTDKAPYGDGNDLYYQCADIVLDATAPEGGVFIDNETPEAGASSSSGAGSSSSSSSGSSEAGTETTPPSDDASSGCALAPADGAVTRAEGILAGVFAGASALGVAIAARRRRQRVTLPKSK